MNLRLGIASFIVMCALGGQAQLVHPAFSNQPVGDPIVRFEAWRDLSEKEPLLILESSSATQTEMRKIHDWNSSGNVPRKVGFSRHLTKELRFGRATPGYQSTRPSIYVPASTDGKVTTYRADIEIEDAYAVRLILEEMNLAPATELILIGADGIANIIDHQRLTLEGRLWTPMVPGPRATVILRVHEKTEGEEQALVVRRVLQILPFADHSTELEPQGVECLRDAKCATSVKDPSDWGKAVGFLVYEKAGDVFICTGGLLNDDGVDGFIPYMLTANHCIDSQAVASSLQVVWDYSSSYCGAPQPDIFSLPRTSGATLLFNSSAVDASLLRLSSAPGGRLYMGWSPRADSLTNGLTLHRYSHPDGRPLSYSSTTLTSTGSECIDSNRPFYIYSTADYGSVMGGSSGSSVFFGDGYVVGQLSGQCGSNLDNNCDPMNRTVDGSFAYLYPSIKQYLRPESTGCGACVSSPTTACVMDGRFKVKVRWRNKFFNPVTEGDGRIVAFGGNVKESHPTHGTLSENVFFSMFPHAPTRVELVVKLFKGVGINDYFWVTAAGLTNNEYWVTVTDTQTCRTWERANPHNQFNTLVDQWAFPIN